MPRTTRRAKNSPRFDNLETRDLLSGVGVNLDANVDWSTANVWADVKNMFRGWGTLYQPSLANPRLQLTPDGYPLSDASAVAMLPDYPDGDAAHPYKLSFEGTATVTLSQLDQQVAGPVVKGPDGVSHADVRFSHAIAAPLTINVTNVNPADPIRNLHLIAPVDSHDPGHTFDDAFLRRVAPFSTLRFMDWMRTNDSDVVEWSDRTKPGDFNQTGPSGVAYEYMIALANAANKDVWVNIPDRASDDFVRKFAQLLRDTLHPGAKIYVEYSNEVWNFGFPQAHNTLAAAKSNPLLMPTDDFGKVAQQSAFRLKGISDIFRQEFDGQSGRVNPVFGGFEGWDYFAKAGLDFIQKTYGAPSQFFSAMAVAPYMDLSADADKAGLSMDGLFADLKNNLATTIPLQIQANKVVADRYGLSLLAYEGGQAMTANNGLNGSLKMAAQDDPRMGDLYRGLMAVWQANGGGLFNNFSHIGAYSQYGYWGLLQNVDQPGSVKWDALMAMSLPTGDATLDGQVGYADFQVLKSNFGQAGRWWENGDFNGDNKVDSADLDLLRSNLGAVTPAQAVDIALFNTPPTDTGGTALVLDRAGRDGGLSYSWSTTKDGVPFSASSGASAPFAPDSNGTYLVTLTVKDAQNHAASGSASISVTGMGMGAPYQVILDSGSPGFGSTGLWFPLGVGAGLGGDEMFSHPGFGPGEATWSFDVAPGTYRVQATWGLQPYLTYAPDAPFTVLDGGRIVGTATVDERGAPSGLATSGAAWRDLGGPYAIAGGKLVVRLSNRASGYVAADAIRVERVADGPTAPAAQLYDGAAAVAPGTGSVDFGAVAVGGQAVRTLTVRNAGTAPLVLAGPIAVPAGFAVASGFGAATLAPGASTTFAVRLDGSAAGSYGGAVSFGTSDPANSPFRFNVSGTAKAADSVVILDNKSAGYSTTGIWGTLESGFGYEGTEQYSHPGFGPSEATWSFDVAPGTYRVQATWRVQPYFTFASDAPFTVLDGAAAVGTAIVDERVAPSGPTASGVAWQDLGGPYTISRGKLVVRLSNRAGTYVAADAIRIEKIG